MNARDSPFLVSSGAARYRAVRAAFAPCVASWRAALRLDAVAAGWELPVWDGERDALSLLPTLSMVPFSSRSPAHTYLSPSDAVAVARAKGRGGEAARAVGAETF